MALYANPALGEEDNLGPWPSSGVGGGSVRSSDAVPFGYDSVRVESHDKCGL